MSKKLPARRNVMGAKRYREPLGGYKKVDPEVSPPLVDGAKDYALEAEPLEFNHVRSERDHVAGFLKSDTPRQRRYERALISVDRGAAALELMLDHYLKSRPAGIAGLVDLILFGPPRVDRDRKEGLIPCRRIKRR